MEGLNRNLYCSPNTIRVIKSRRMRQVGHVTFVEERTGEERFIQDLLGKLKETSTWKT